LGILQINYLFKLLLRLEEQIIGQMNGFGSQNKIFVLCFYLRLDFSFAIYSAQTEFLGFLITSFYLLSFSFSSQSSVHFSFPNRLQI
jgi:hypothetical protein